MSTQTQVERFQELQKPHAMWGRKTKWPGSGASRVEHADHVMMMAQGRGPIWADERLTRTDRGVIQAREKLKAAHAREVAARAARGEDTRPLRRRAQSHAVGR